MIPYLRKAPEKSTMSIKRTFSEIFETLSDKSFIAIFLTTLVGATATGLSAGLNYYINNFFWEFTTEQVSLLQISVIISALFALFIGPWASRKWGKKRTAIGMGIIAFSTTPMPVALRLMGVMPDNGGPILFPIIFMLAMVDLTLIICFLALGQSMVDDVVIAHQAAQRRCVICFYHFCAQILSRQRGNDCIHYARNNRVSTAIKSGRNP
jgi:Na+/melibiose symporter-like transporter